MQTYLQTDQPRFNDMIGYRVLQRKIGTKVGVDCISPSPSYKHLDLLDTHP